MPKSDMKSSLFSSMEYVEEETNVTAIEMTFILKGETPEVVPPKQKGGPVEWDFIHIFNGFILFEDKWKPNKVVEYRFPFNLYDDLLRDLVIANPLILLLRPCGGKPGKDPDPLNHPDNRAGATIDLMPLIIGTNEISYKVNLINNTGGYFGCHVIFRAVIVGSALKHNLVPLVLTMISAHCFPNVKENTVYISAIGLDGFSTDPKTVNFGMALSNATAKKIVWAGASTGGQLMNSAYNVPDDDKFIPSDFKIKTNSYCNSVYWNTVNRVLIDPQELLSRLQTPFYIEVAGVPRLGKIDVRGRYMGFVDAGALLQPSQTTLITCAKLRYFNEANLPASIGPLLELPAVSQKSTARGDPLICEDAQGHNPYVILRFDLREPLIPKISLISMFESIGFPPPETYMPLTDFHHETPEDPSVDVRKIRQECGALAVHKELSNLACIGAVQMNQSIKRTAANRLLTRVRTMLKQFAPDDNCTEVEWQDTVTGQHAASRRAVNSSFRPQPPPKRISGPLIPARARMAGDTRLANKYIDYNLECNDKHPRTLLSKALRCLEARNDTEAHTFVVKAISEQTRNRFLLWLLGALKFDKGEEFMAVAKSAFQIAVKGDYSDGIACTIGWAALHTLYHFEGDHYGAFVAAKKMRKSFELKTGWPEFYQRWVDASGEEEELWVPRVLQDDNPLLIAAAFFLCLRCYKFSDLILHCLEEECATRGSRLGLKTKITADIYYLRAISFMLRHRNEDALKLIEVGIKKFGPSSIMSQIRATCLMAIRHGRWDEECSMALGEADRSGAEIPSAQLLQAALSEMNVNSERALQYAARAHKATPCAYTALAIARIYHRKKEYLLSEKWAAGAVKLEPWLADAWAVLALLAMGERDTEKARAMLRTANQVGSISPDIENQLKKVMRIVKVEDLAISMTKNLCFCDYFHSLEDQ